MKRYLSALLLIIALIPSMKGQKSFNALVFTGTSGFYHKSTPAAQKAMVALGAANNFGVDTTSDPAVFFSGNLDKYKVVIFLSTGGEDLLNDAQQAVFEEYINGGGNFVGIHGASATEYNWEWYGRLVGAFFDNHPKIQDGIIRVINHNHPSTAHLPAEWTWSDEWYNWRQPLPEHITVLATVDESTYEGGKMGEFHPIIWCQEVGNSRSWYTALGHKSEHFSDENFMQHILGGINWAVSGDK